MDEPVVSLDVDRLLAGGQQLELIAGTNRDTSKSQYFTPAKLAQRVVDWALVGTDWHRRVGGFQGARVLEPSAGNGALVRPLVAAGAEVMAIELDRRYMDELNTAGPSWALHANFLEMTKSVPLGTVDFDLCVGNFPYHDNLAAEFTRHALLFCPRVVAVYQADIFYTVGRYDGLWTHARPTRAAMLARRPWPGETDYVVLEIVKKLPCSSSNCQIEFWPDAWR